MIEIWSTSRYVLAGISWTKTLDKVDNVFITVHPNLVTIHHYGLIHCLHSIQLTCSFQFHQMNTGRHREGENTGNNCNFSKGKLNIGKFLLKIKCHVSLSTQKTLYRPSISKKDWCSIQSKVMSITHMFCALVNILAHFL